MPRGGPTASGWGPWPTGGSPARGRPTSWPLDNRRRETGPRSGKVDNNVNKDTVDPNLLGESSPQAGPGTPPPAAAPPAVQPHPVAHPGPMHKDNLPFLIGGTLGGVFTASLALQPISARRPPPLP